MVEKKVKKQKKDFCEQIVKWQKDPEFLREVREFIRATTS